MRRIALVIALAAFSVLTAIAVWQHGYIGIFAWQMQNTAGLQVLADLGIALTLFLAWMWPDARRRGRSPWLWAVLTLAAGSLGALLYLVTQRDTA